MIGVERSESGVLVGVIVDVFVVVVSGVVSLFEEGLRSIGVLLVV